MLEGNPVPGMTLSGKNLGRRIGSTTLFEGISFDLRIGESLAIIGHNGSGKSTLLKTIYGFDSPTSGEVSLKVQGNPVPSHLLHTYISFSGPYLNLPDNLTVDWFLNHHFSVRQASLTVAGMCGYLGLSSVSHLAMRHLSSGQRQRVRLAISLFDSAVIALLDEPGTNLDAGGIQIYRSLIKEVQNKKIIVIASNDPVEYDFCAATCHLGSM